MLEALSGKSCASSGISAPPGGFREIEDYAVDLVDVGVLELIIVPDKSGGEARASLVKMRLA